MIDVLAVPTMLALVGWITVFNVLRHFAARAAQREEGGDYVQLVLHGGWRRSGSKAARRWTIAAFTWLLVAPPVILGAFVAWFARR